MDPIGSDLKSGLKNETDPKSAEPPVGLVRKVTTVRNLPKLDRKASFIIF
jgi:hypothetical protein